MAVMFPKVGPQNTGSIWAEPDVYWRLAKQLSNEFTVIHSLPWLASVAKEIDGRPVPTGEIDFLVLHQNLGILAVDVKGGIVTHNGTEFVYKRTGEKIDPIRQVRRGIHALAKWLHGSGAGSWRIGYCILFPDSEMSESIPIALIDHTVNPTQPIVLDIRHLNNLGTHIQQVMLYWQQSLEIWPIKKQKLQKLIDVIVPSSDYTPCWQTRINNDLVTWLQLTPEQAKCLNKISQETRSVVTGFPGTGKTLLLIEHARRLSKSGQKVLVITYNSLLAKHIRDELSNIGVEVCTFHEQCRRAARITGNPIPIPSDSFIQKMTDQEWYSTTGPNALQQALNAHKLPNYDYLVVDEGQVLHIDWWQILVKWFDKKSIVVFCDSTQVFKFENSTFPEEIAVIINAKSPYTLTINLRSPRTIFERILQVKSIEYQQFCPRPLEPDTLSEIVVEDMDSALQKVVNKSFEEGVSKQSIVILNTVYGAQKEGSYLGIKIFSASKFRGLESPVVIIWAGLRSDETSLFCAYTRATSRCIVIYNAVGILKGNYKTFGQTILESDKTGNIQKEASSKLTSVIFNDQGFDLISAANKTINLYWCSNWNGWIIYPRESDQIARLMWTYHLIITANFPVCVWDAYDTGSLKYFQAVKQLGELSYRLCNPAFCSNCEVITPFVSIMSTFGNEVNECTVCSYERDSIELNEIRIQTEFDSILAPGSQALNSDKKKLSIFLMTLGIWNTIAEEQRQEFNSYVPVSSGTIGYNVAHLLILTDILKIQEKEDKTLQLDEMATRYRAKWCPDLVKRIDEKSWRKMVAHGLNTWSQHKVINKIARGVYERTVECK
jgi:AAA domain/Nuclease-related domain